MSISLLLVPAALAVIGVLQAARERNDEQGRTICQVQTRMRDEGLLAAALRDTQAQVQRDSDKIVADWQGVRAEFARDEQGIWQADFTGEVDVQKATDIVMAIDQAYGRQVQQAVLARLRAQAPAAGMVIESEEVDDEDNVTVVLNVGAGG